MFGIGGAEWLIIGGIIVLLFVPSAAFFAAGYFVGQRVGGTSDGTDPRATSADGPDAPAGPGDDDA